MVRGLVIDDERLKNPTAVPTTFQDFTIDSGQALA
jgi:hypothetical protein